MTSKQIVEQFEKTWFYNRKITMDFMDAVPADKWNYTHNPKFAPIAKQFRHMTCVYGVFIEAFQIEAVDFSRKHSHYTGPLDREQIKNDLLKKDELFKSVLNQYKEKGVEYFSINFYGVNMSFTEFTHVLIQHECMHIGIWSTMAAFGGFELPSSWKTDWGFN